MLRNAVVVAEVALCFVLLIGSGLMFRSFLELQKIDPGFDSHHLLAFQLLGGRRLPQPEQRAAFERDLKAKFSAIPGVTSASAALFFPLTGGYSPIRWGNESSVADPRSFKRRISNWCCLDISKRCEHRYWRDERLPMPIMFRSEPEW